MTTRTIQNLTFDVPSPSFWQLVCPATGEPLPIDISFLGGEAATGWYLFCPDEAGDPRAHACPSRDAAIALVARAFRDAGHIPAGIIP